MEGRWKKVAADGCQPRKSPSDGSGNAHASKTTKRGAAGFGVVSGEENLGPAPWSGVAVTGEHHAWRGGGKRSQRMGAAEKISQ